MKIKKQEKFGQEERRLTMNKRNLFKGLTKVLFTFCLLLTICVINSSEVRAEEEGFWQYEVMYDGTVRITNYTGVDLNVVVPSKLGGKTVTVIGNWTCPAFKNNTFIENVTIPSTVKYIGEDTFTNCVNLKTVSGCAGVETIDMDAFMGCTSLESVALGNNLKTIKSYAFAGCTKLKTVKIPYQVNHIGEKAFENCTSLTSVTFSSNVNIGKHAFLNCDALKTIKLGVNTTLSEGTFRDCDNLETVVINEGTKEISELCFKKCPNLKNITFGSSVSTIRRAAFEECTGLEKIELPSNIRIVEGYAFGGCKSVNSIKLSYGLYEIGEKAFSNMSLITNVTIPNSVTKVYDNVFEGCSYLEYVVAPRSITKVNGWNLHKTFSGAKIKCYEDSYIYKLAIEEKLSTELIIDETPCTGISFSTTSKTIFEGETFRLSPIVTPSNNITDVIVWESGDANIASVNDFGDVTGKKAGTCAIVASVKRGGKTLYRATYTVTVTKGPKEVKFSEDSKVGVVGKTFTCKPVAKENDVVRTDVKYTFRSSDKTIATVSNSGLVTPKKAGLVVISAEATNGLRATYALTVVNTMKLESSSITKKLNVTSCVYNGQARKPSVVATLNGTKLVSGTDFTVTYKNNTYPGTASVVVTGKGKFTGTVTLKMVIKAPSITAKQNTSAYATNSVTVKWGKVTGVTGYEVYRSTSKSSGYKKVGTTTGVSFKNTGLSSGKTYYYKVKAYKTVSSSKKYIVTSSAVTTGTRPATPVAKVTAGTKKATVTWKAVTGASGYEVYMSTSKNGTYSKVKAVGSSTKTLTKTGLTKGKRYYFKVKAYKTINGVKVFSGASTVVSVVAK